MKYCANKGFTLAELMAVVVIIGIIAVVGIGSYSKAVGRAQAREGLNLALQVAAARDAYYYDRVGMSESSRQTNDCSKLDISVKGTCSGSKITTKNFELTLSSYGYVEAVSKPASYTITVYQEGFGRYKGQAPECTSTDSNAEGAKICKDLGL